MNQNNPADLGTNSSAIARHEAAWLIGSLLVLFLINFLTADKTPTVWCDEVMYQDPAVNLYQGRGFTSSAWFLQPRDKFWAGNVPFYQLLLFGWFKAFGFGILSVRSFHFAAFTLAILAAWSAIRRFNLIKTPQHRLLFCLLACLCAPSAFVYRFARPESLGMLLVASALSWPPMLV